MEKIHIGQKLLIDDLTDTQWQRMYADPFSLSSMLKECGISFIELSVKEVTEDSLVIKLAENFARSGLFVSLHPHFHSFFSPEIFDNDSRSFIKKKLSVAQEVGNITGVPVPYVIHGGQAMAEPFFIQKEPALQKCKNFMTFIDNITVEEFGNVVPLCETQIPNLDPEIQGTRLGDTWESCLDLVEHTSVGICWDYGHTYIASVHGKHNIFPEEHFLARVNHVHAHDVMKKQSGFIDHLPLNEGAVPWREYNAILARHEFSGTVLIEINPRSFYGLDKFLNGTADGVKKMRAFFC